MSTLLDHLTFHYAAGNCPGTLARICRCALITWRLILSNLPGRETPGLPTETLCTGIEPTEWGILRGTCGSRVRALGGRAVLPLLLGAYLNYERKQHAVPRHQVLRAGSAQLAMIARLVAQTRRLKENSKLKADEIDGICTVR